MEPPKINKWLETVEEKVTYKINKNEELLEKRWAFLQIKERQLTDNILYKYERSIRWIMF